MGMDCFRKQNLNLRQCKDGFRKSVELHFRQNLHPRSHAFHSGTTGDEPVSALSPFAFFTVGNPIFVLLGLALELSQLLLTGGPLGFQFC